MCSHKYLTIKPVYTTLCLYTKNTKVFTKHYDSYLKKDPHVFSQILNYKTCLYNFVSLHKKYQRSSCVFPQNTTIHIRVTIKPVYTTLCLYTKIPKILLCFHKTLRFISEKKILMCSHKYLTIKPVYTTLCLYIKNTKVFTKHYDSYLKKKILMCSHKYLTIKPVYTTLCLYTKNTKDPPVFFPQNTTIHLSE